MAIPAFQITDPVPVVESMVVDESLSPSSVEFLPPPKPRIPVLDLALPPTTRSFPTTVEHQPGSNQETSHVEAGDTPHQSQPQSALPPYTIPPWSNPPCHPFHLEVLKGGSIVDQYNVSEKGAYMFGRIDLCDFILEHPTISRFHAVLQFKKNGQAYLYDLGSTHGTFVNKSQVKAKVYVELHVGALIRFGQSSRLYIFQGPGELMPPEADLENIRNTKVRQEIQDREASLLRAKQESSAAAGISWGMGEDAVEEIEDEIDEVTWQTYKGQLTEKQEKTREKVLKRYEKIGHMKKEIGAIRAKDISQGGLTQGQQTQIARNEQRISQIAEELENLEETLNDSILESLGARSRKVPHGKKAAMEEGDDFSSDDDEFYDRTEKRKQPKKNAAGIETADGLLDKKESIVEEIEAKKKLLLVETSELQAQEAQTGDELDAFMSGLSSELVLDKSARIEKEISCLQTELDRILFLLNIADPSGEASKKRNLKPDAAVRSESETHKDSTKDSIQTCIESNQNPISKDSIIRSKFKEPKCTLDKDTSNTVSGNGNSEYVVAKAQWLGAVNDCEKIEKGEIREDLEEKDEFVDYKDRKRILGSGEPLIVDAAPGLIIRKRKLLAEEEEDESAVSMAEDAVALLLKHTRGLHRCEEIEDSCTETPKNAMEEGNGLDFESWVPPKGQSGDGKTSLNERYGY